MKRKRIQYNELTDEIYGPKYWTVPKLFLMGITLLGLGFLFNFSLEERINKWLVVNLSSNEACPILFEKAELSFFLPKIIIRKPVILGNCFGQINNRLHLQDIKIAFNSPSFYPPGIKLHVEINEGKTSINLYPTISPFTQFVDIEDTTIDTKIFGVMASDNKSAISGIIKIDGTLKFTSWNVDGGNIDIKSKDFSLPAQNIKGFELTQIQLKKLDISTHFTTKSTMQIDRLDLGQAGTPIELKLKGNLLLNSTNFLSSVLQLQGPLKLSNDLLANFSFLKLFLPQDNTSGTYQMKINGPLGNLGPPQIK
jgi:hypothetical protein